ncbi:ammonium transporter [Terrilactibacillus sp. BCM23-1]|uniref:Ammonium transporter n=1 Tax=Terrilactibacillus tamarindi TaxID=2599694 RepID=A0A6N8CVK2_9BACI|nr:ammonium transporter [Terrilactibacillus tamarindi]MTT33305.1 ammonium transporter [Terrilactibacillus tamarindi]
MNDVKFMLDSLWVIIAAILVIGMQMGFALLETGSIRAKNAGHVAGKQILSFAIASLAFWAFGFAITFGNGNGFFGVHGWFLGNEKAFDSVSWMNIPLSIKFLFQLSFAAVSLAIAWGGFAERAKLVVYFIFGILFTVLIYPVVGHWVWGGGWLAEMGMQDFAGSTVVHLQGAIAALIATILLGPRIGKFNKDGSPNTIGGHNMVYTVMGGFILWLGWFGFNAGSTGGTADGFFGYVALTTNLAAAAGAIAALLTAMAMSRKADIGAMVNGVLAALVAITASCAFVAPWAAVVIGAVAGSVTYWTSVYFEKKGIDDPIYAFSVHGIAGVIGTLSTGFFATKELAVVGKPGLFYGGGLHQLGVQALGIVTAAVYVAIVSFIVLAILKATVGLRVKAEDEMAGLDIAEHGAYGYPETFETGKNQNQNKAL